MGTKKIFATPDGINDSGGTRKPIKLDDEIAYPLISDEYAVIKEKIQDVKLDNWQTFLLSTAVTSLIAIIISCFTYDFYKTVKTEKIPIISSFIVVGIYSIITLSFGIGLLFSYKYKNALDSSFNRIDTKILKTFKTEK
jgi:hypothetical protein